MALSQPRAIFGVHSVTPYDRSTGLPYGILKVLGSSSLSLSGSLVELHGGSSKYPWAVEESKVSAQLSLKVREYPDFLFQLFGGVTPTVNAADALAAVSTLTAKYGTTAKSATIGVASVAVKTGSEADVKYGKYIVKVASATTVNVYMSSDLDHGRGTAGSFQDDGLKITATALTIAMGAAVDIPGHGLSLTGGSGTIAMVVGDTATFETRPKNTASIEATFGKVSAVYPEFGALIYAKKLGNGQMVEVDAMRCKGEGVPLDFEENKYSDADIKVTLMYDSTQDAVLRLRHLTPISPN